MPYNRDDVINGLSQYYDLLVYQGYLDPSSIQRPSPSEGRWNDEDLVSVEYLRRVLGRSDEVIDLIRHLPYLGPLSWRYHRYAQDTRVRPEVVEVYPSTRSVAYHKHSFRPNCKFFDLANYDQKDGSICCYLRMPFHGEWPAGMIPLTFLERGLGGTAWIVDTEQGYIWSVRDLESNPPVVDATAPESEPWTRYGYAKDIPRFFEDLHTELVSLKIIPVPLTAYLQPRILRYDGTDDEKPPKIEDSDDYEQVREDPQKIASLLTEYGWPETKEQLQGAHGFRRTEYLEAVKAYRVNLREEWAAQKYGYGSAVSIQGRTWPLPGIQEADELEAAVVFALSGYREKVNSATHGAIKGTVSWMEGREARAKHNANMRVEPALIEQDGIDYQPGSDDDEVEENSVGQFDDLPRYIRSRHMYHLKYMLGFSSREMDPAITRPSDLLEHWDAVAPQLALDGTRRNPSPSWRHEKREKYRIDILGKLRDIFGPCPVSSDGKWLLSAEFEILMKHADSLEGCGWDRMRWTDQVMVPWGGLETDPMEGVDMMQSMLSSDTEKYDMAGGFSLGRGNDYYLYAVLSRPGHDRARGWKWRYFEGIFSDVVYESILDLLESKTKDVRSARWVFENGFDLNIKEQV